MNHEIIPVSNPVCPTDHNDPKAASTALQICIPDYLDGSIALFQYKDRFVLTDEGLELSAYEGCRPRWIGSSLKDLEAWLEKTCDEYDANPALYPGWISLNDPKQWDWDDESQAPHTAEDSPSAE